LEQRLAALRDYDILDTPREAEFDAVVKVVSAICETPISVINLIDAGQWFKAEVGLGVREMPIDSSICAHAILQPGLFVVPDTTKDERFLDNPLVAGDPLALLCWRTPGDPRSARYACWTMCLAN
jgi:GAF domain-containing protein